MLETDADMSLISQTLHLLWVRSQLGPQDFERDQLLEASGPMRASQMDLADASLPQYAQESISTQGLLKGCHGGILPFWST
jgi:hypothetical protein